MERSLDPVIGKSRTNVSVQVSLSLSVIDVNTVTSPKKYELIKR